MLNQVRQSSSGSLLYSSEIQLTAAGGEEWLTAQLDYDAQETDQAMVNLVDVSPAQAQASATFQSGHMFVQVNNPDGLSAGVYKVRVSLFRTTDAPLGST